ncbi:hypothetical protein GBF38_000216, partial [Nibea albiflora]
SFLQATTSTIQTGIFGATPMEEEGMLQLLIEGDAFLEATTSTIQTGIFGATPMEEEGMLQLLIEGDAFLEATTSTIQTGIFGATPMEEEGMLQLLIEGDAFLEVREDIWLPLQEELMKLESPPFKCKPKNHWQLSAEVVKPQTEALEKEIKSTFFTRLVQDDQQDDGTQNSGARTTPHSSDDQQDDNAASSSSTSEPGQRQLELSPITSPAEDEAAGNKSESTVYVQRRRL